VPDLPRGRGRSISGDLDIDEEGSEQMIVTLQSLHHGSVGYQHANTRVGLTKRLILASAIKNTNKNRKECN
jgi:hypothetical protein